MSFKVEITEDYTKMDGKTDEILVGLALYARALRMNKIPEEIIVGAFKLGLKDDETTECNKIKVHRLNVRNMSKRDTKKFIEKEIFKIFDED